MVTVKVKDIIRRILKHPIGRGIIANVIGGIILAILSFLFVVIKSLLSRVKIVKAFDETINFLNNTVEIKIYLLAIIILIVAYVFLYKKYLVSLVLSMFNDDSESHADSNVSKISMSSTAFFSYRVAKAFPGVRGIEWISEPKSAIKNLEVLLKDPLIFDSAPDIEGVVKRPIWFFRGHQSIDIFKFEKINRTKCLINFSECKIEKIAVYRCEPYYREFVYVELSPEDQTGLYNYTESDIERRVKNFGYADEEYGLYKGKYKITRNEYDDGAAEIHGKIVDVAGNVELRVRYLTKYNFLITGKFSPYNSPRFDMESEKYFNGVITGGVRYDEMFEFLKSLKKYNRFN